MAKLKSSSITQKYHRSLLREGLLLVWSWRTDDLLATGISLSPPPQQWGYKYVLPHLAFLGGFWGSNSDPLAWQASTSPTELSLRPPHMGVILPLKYESKFRRHCKRKTNKPQRKSGLLGFSLTTVLRMVLENSFLARGGGSCLDHHRTFSSLDLHPLDGSASSLNYDTQKKTPDLGKISCRQV